MILLASIPAISLSAFGFRLPTSKENKESYLYKTKFENYPHHPWLMAKRQTKISSNKNILNLRLFIAIIIVRSLARLIFRAHGNLCMHIVQISYPHPKGLSCQSVQHKKGAINVSLLSNEERWANSVNIRAQSSFLALGVEGCPQ